MFVAGAIVLAIGSGIGCGSSRVPEAAPTVSASSSGGGGGASTTAGGAPAGADPFGADAARAIAPEVIAAAEKARGTATGATDAASAIARGATGDDLWAAVYVYSADGEDPDVLEPLLKHENASIRVLAAGGLLRLGRASAFDALVGEVGNTSMLEGSEPPQPVGEIAASMLALASGEVLDAVTGPDAEKAWGDWYKANGSRLTYDPTNGWTLR